MLAKKVSDVPSGILLYGETGVGKEVIANLIHQCNNEKDTPFIKLNCGAIPENLIESELFGYEKGAYTGANIKGKTGFIQLAHKGVLFLDEIGELPLSSQVKLLRVLQEKKIVKLGGTQEIDVDVQVIAATNRDLSVEIKKGNFRSDLYYRLNVIPISIPPLRERKEDIIPLITYFNDKFNKQYDRNHHFSAKALDLLKAYDWPGNVRELQNVIERLIVTAETQTIGEKDLPISVNRNQNPIQVNSIIPLKIAIETTERRLLELASSKYSTTVEISKALSIDQSTVSRKLKKYNIQ